ncbi:MAG TPA: TetR/AcrR family transcriptional regulator [Caulobacteraceae bacterium]|nr:TetR/AcrR family transcriptional regulator [Caulobacteraceae bacterium]
MTDAPRPKTRARSAHDREAARDRLCQVAAGLFAEHGAEGFSMRRLAEAAGCSAMAPYRYFPDKDSLLAAVRAEAFDRFADALEGVKKEGRRRASDIGEAYVRFALDNPQAYKLMFDVSQPDEARFPDLVRASSRAGAGMTGYVRELVDAGVLAGDPDLIGYALWAAIHGVIVLALAGKLPDEPGFEAIRLATVGAVMRGFRPGGGRSMIGPA